MNKQRRTLLPTPGNWNALVPIKREGDSVVKLTNEDGSPGTTIAVLSGEIKQSKANAYLMAAATDLLEALEASIPYVNNFGLESVKKKAENAINKAKGKFLGIEWKDLENIEIDGVDPKDYPDFCDAFLSYAEHNGRPLTEEELILIEEENPSEFFDAVYQTLID